MGSCGNLRLNDDLPGKGPAPHILGLSPLLLASSPAAGLREKTPHLGRSLPPDSGNKNAVWEPG